MGQLRRGCSGFFELVLWVDNVQYRPVGVYGPGEREFTILSMDKEKGNRLVEDPDCARPKRRRQHLTDRSNISDYFPQDADR